MRTGLTHTLLGMLLHMSYSQFPLMLPTQLAGAKTWRHSGRQLGPRKQCIPNQFSPTSVQQDCSTPHAQQA